KELEAKFGSGSEFEKRMKELGKEMEAKFGPGSEFEKRMKELGKEMDAKFGPGSEFERKIKESVASSSLKEPTGKLRRQTSRDARPDLGRGDAAASAKVRKRERRIQELEAQVRKLVDEIKTLKAQESGDETE